MTKEDFERDRKSIKNITTETHEADGESPCH